MHCLYIKIPRHVELMTKYYANHTDCGRLVLRRLYMMPLTDHANGKPASPSCLSGKYATKQRRGTPKNQVKDVLMHSRLIKSLDSPSAGLVQQRLLLRRLFYIYYFLWITVSWCTMSTVDGKSRIRIGKQDISFHDDEVRTEFDQVSTSDGCAPYPGSCHSRMMWSL